MIRIFFKTLWNSRMRNILVFIELFIISLVLVNLTVYFTERTRIRIIKSSVDYRNVVCLHIYQIGEEDTAKSKQSIANLKLRLESGKLVEAVSFSYAATPFYSSPISNDYKLGDEKVTLYKQIVDIDYAKVMKIKPVKGRWFDESDKAKTIKPVLISKSVEKRYFNGDAPGKIFGDKSKFEIIGVTDEFKRVDNEEPRLSGFFYRDDFSGDFSRMDILVRVKPGQVDNFLTIAGSEILSVVDPKVWTVTTQDALENMRSSQKIESIQQRYIGILLAIFVMINVLLGVIGILWYNTNLRIHEIGVKRALGASGNSIKGILMLENLVLGGLGLIVVALVYIQVPNIRITKVGPSVMYLSVFISVIAMILLILLSTWIPASIASKVRPAEALKTE